MRSLNVNLINCDICSRFSVKLIQCNDCSGIVAVNLIKANDCSGRVSIFIYLIL